MTDSESLLGYTIGAIEALVTALSLGDGTTHVCKNLDTPVHDLNFDDRTESRAARQGCRGGGFADRTEARAARQGGRGGGFADRTEAALDAFE